jgi:ABC-type nitrate/sulfonate/bicarbonate transport system substrate-binding protein
MLREAGLAPEDQGGDVTIQGLKNPELPAAFDSNSIDAAFYPDPAGIAALERPNAKLLLDVKDTWRGGDYPTTVLIAPDKLDPKLQAILRDATRAAVDRIRTDPQGVVADLQREIAALVGEAPSPDKITASLRTNVATTDINADAVAAIVTETRQDKYIDADVPVADLLRP